MCTLHACGNEFPADGECSLKLGGDPGLCAGCPDGRPLDFNSSMIRTPPGADPGNLSLEVIETICTFQPMDELFAELGPAGNYTWAYVATITGVHRVWPGLPIARGLDGGDPELGDCRIFDPRIRPWFIAGSSGPKDVVIVLDTSDVLVAELQADDQDFRSVFDRIIERTAICSVGDINACQLQVLRGDKSECPDIFEERPCFHLVSAKKFYTVDLEHKLPFEEAADACIQLGGRLAEPLSDEEHTMLSGLATREGCWIGLRKDTRDVPFIWRWLESKEDAEQPFPVRDVEHTLWASRAKGEDDCAAVDRRGRTKNVFETDCERKMEFICEFDESSSPDRCLGDDILRVDKGYDPVVPRISDCSDYELALIASTSVVPATRDIDPAKVVCPLGEKQRTTKDVQCCCGACDV
eukprot:evm.model.scf_371.6 EVM.evm.TU.scf_371.6   scf_371:86204-95556(+)